MKYTTARISTGNYDFMIAKYGYQWFMDYKTAEEAIEQMKIAAQLDEIPYDMIPEEGKMNVQRFLKVNSKNSLNLREIEKMKDYFRGISEKNLAYLCPKLVKNEKKL